MIRTKRKTSLGLLLVLSLVLSGIPFPGRVNTVSATETAIEQPEETPSDTVAMEENWDGMTAGEIKDGDSGTGYTWSFSNAVANSINIVPKSTVVEGAAENDMCLQIAHPAYTNAPQFRMKFNEAISFESTDYIVVEMDIATTGTGSWSRFRFFTYDLAGSKTPTRAYLQGANSSFMNINTSNKSKNLTKNQFYNVKYVINASNGTYSMYIDNTAFVEDMAFNTNGTGATDLGRLHFDIQSDYASEVDVQFYADNVKVYTTAKHPMATPAPTAEPTPEPTPAPTAEPTAVPEIIHAVNENWDGQTAGSIADGTTGNGFAWNFSGYVANCIQVVPKSTVIGGDATSDMCVQISHPVYSKAPMFKMDLNEALAFSSTNYVVVKMDIAVAGTDYWRQLRIFTYDSAKSKTPTRAQLQGASNSYVNLGENNQKNLTKNQFYTVMYVIEKGESTDATYSLYIDGTPLAEGSALNTVTADLGRLHFDIQSDYASEVDVQFYLDNVEVYSAKKHPMATAEPTMAPPTPEPTADPTPKPDTIHVVKENWDNVEIGDIVDGDEGTNYAWDINSAAAGTMQVITKDSVFSGADASDRCVVLTHKVFSGNPSYYIQLNDGKEIALGETEEGWAVIEYDMAISGADGFGRLRTIIRGNNSNNLARGNLMTARYYDNTTEEGRTLDKDTFHSIKYVFDRAAKKYSVYIDGNPLAVNQNLMTPAATNINRFHMDIDKGNTEERDAKLYLDNLQIYSTVKDPTVTPAPTAPPTAPPTPSPTLKPTPKPDTIYFVDENWDNVAVGDIASGDEGTNYVWSLDSAASGTMQVVAKDSVFNGADASDRCVVISHKVFSSVPDYYIQLNEGKELALGADAEGYAVVSFQLAITGEDGFLRSRFLLRNNGNNLMTGDLRTSHFWDYNGEGASLEKGVFHNFVYVVNASAETYTLYVDGKVIDGGDLRTKGTGALNRFHIDVYEGYDTERDAKLYLDNLKIYSTVLDPTPTAAPTAAPTATPIPTATPEPTATPGPTATPSPTPMAPGFVVDESWNDMPLGEVVTGTKGNGWTWYVGKPAISVVAKDSVVTGASATDKCIAIAWGGAENTGSPNFYIYVDEDRKIAFGEGTTGYAVLEMELAVSGDVLLDTWKVPIRSRGAKGTDGTEVARFEVQDGLGEGAIYEYYSQHGIGEMGKNTFRKVQYIFNRKAGTYDFFIDGEQYAENQPFKTAGCTDLGAVLFTAVDDANAVNAKLYIDNVKMYSTENNPAPTPKPTATPAPTATPIPVGVNLLDLDFDNYDDGTVFHDNHREDNYEWIISADYDVNGAVVVPKSNVLTGASAADKCVEFAFDPSIVDANGWFYITMRQGEEIPLGEGNDGFAVWEMKIATNNEEVNTPYWISPVTSYSTEPWAYASTLYIDGKTLYEKDVPGYPAEMGENTFHHVVYSINRAEKTYSYAVDGVVKVSNAPIVDQNITNLGSVEIRIDTNITDVDSKLWMDDVKMYLAETDPMLEAPTSSPAPHTHEADTNGYCTTCREIANDMFAVYGKSLNLSDDIGVIFYMEYAPDFDRSDMTVKMTLTGNGKSITLDKSDEIYKYIQSTGKNIYGFRCPMYVSEMNNDIKVEVSVGGELIATYSYSVSEYCANKKNNVQSAANKELMNVINSVLVFGAKSQAHFGLDSDGLVTDGFEDIPALEALTETEIEELGQTVYKRDDIVPGTGYFTRTPMTLVLYSQTALRMGLFFEGNYKTEDFTYEGYNVTKDNEPLAGRSGVYGGETYYEIPNITPTELDDVYKIVVKYKGVIVKAVEYSPFTYINNKKTYNPEYPELADVVTALYRYNKAAEAYANAN